MRVAFQGERGAYSEEAVIQLFGEVDVLPHPSLRNVFETVTAGRADRAVVPAENSQAGSINETYDLLLAHSLFITGELDLRIRHCLLALPGQALDAIHRAFSHPQALAQCDAFLRQHGLEPVPAYDTAGSAKMVADQRLRGAAAIAGRGAARIYGLSVLEVVPTLRSLLLVIDPLTADRDRLAGMALQLLSDLRPDHDSAGRLIELPVVYGGDAGPDLDDVAQRSGLTRREAIELHSRQDYRVLMLGFAPGFPYLGVMADLLRSPRLSTPRTRVPAGSVGVADALTGVYPLPTPGGWRLIGRTPQILYDLRNPDPILFRPGDRVRFLPVVSASFPDVPLGSPAPLHPPKRPLFEVRDPGLFTTAQDLGRTGHRNRGLPPAGAMDPSSLQFANLLVGNRPQAAALECTAPGPALRALDEVTVAVTGADLSASLEGREVPLWAPIEMQAGQTLSFGAPRRGMWAYVGVAGGIDIAAVLGSAATYVTGAWGGLGGRRLRAGGDVGRG